ncbi:DUF4271 domain-containing protein [Nemorincola caseinilytica]|uniref:DUF4271 domain-containing protein n=1 Tax=Nemorincola caseinilytica TaxID=2054315 RepID=UPI0031E77F93
MRYIFLVLLLLAGTNVQAQAPDPVAYGIDTLTDSATLAAWATYRIDSTFAEHPMLASPYVIGDVQSLHQWVSQTSDFYLLLSLCFILGLIRYMDTRYFTNLWRAFVNPTLSNRQLKEQLQSAGLPNFLMNVFFAFAGGAYIYYVVKFFTAEPQGSVPPSLLIIMLIAGTGIIYVAKYAAVRFSGWAFRVEGITEHYLFNVFLINKILAITLLPFIIVLAFGGREWVQQVVVVSFIAAGALLLNRYMRSWKVFGSFFQYSKFHFFMYLCASELLPLAVLMKLLVKGLMFY